MNKADAKRFVYEMTYTSLRKRKSSITSGQISMNASQKDVTKVHKEMDELADYLEAKINRKRNVEDDQADVGGESGPVKAEVPTVREP